LTSGGTRKGPAIAFITGTWDRVTVTHDRDGDAVFYHDGAEIGRLSTAGADRPRWQNCEVEKAPQEPAAESLRPVDQPDADVEKA
jgi:hypothetical protein